MTSSPERILELAKEALAEQERQVAEMRSRAPALLAAGAVVASLLARTVFHGPHPTGLLEVGFTILGAVGGVAVLGGGLLLLAPYELGFSLDPLRTYQDLLDQGASTQPDADLALVKAMGRRRRLNEKVTRRLVTFLRLALIGLVGEALGLAVAAVLAS